jgi:glycosyltransferase involved in cell wall biosynthesis
MEDTFHTKAVSRPKGLEGKQGGPRFSVIVLFERGEPEPCLSSVLAQKDVDFELIAVTNPGAGLKGNDRLCVIEVPEKNPAHRRNRAAEQAQGEILAFIDDDALAPEDWLKQAGSLFADRPEIACIGGSNIAPEDQGLLEQVSDLILATPLIGSGNPTYRGSGVPRPARAGDIHLSNFFVRKHAFEKIRGFNEGLGYGAEDSEFLYLGQKRYGMNSWFYPGLTVKHRRRAFGIPYLKQRFNFRRQNGRILLVYPGMYLGNRSLQIALAAVLSVIILLALLPWLWSWLALGYYILTLVFSLSSSSPGKARLLRLLPLLPFAYFLHHVAYFSGLILGIAEGVFLVGPGKLRKRLKR